MISFILYRCLKNHFIGAVGAATIIALKKSQIKKKGFLFKGICYIIRKVDSEIVYYEFRYSLWEFRDGIIRGIWLREIQTFCIKEKI